MKKELSEMTEKEMRERIEEIDKCRQELKTEKDMYESYMYNKRKEEDFNSRQKYIGKCFTKLKLANNHYSYVKAFKILSIVDENNCNYAEVLAIIDGALNTCFRENGILRMVLPLWTPNTESMISRKDDLKVIDYYQEISNLDFNKEIELELDEMNTIIGN